MKRLQGVLFFVKLRLEHTFAQTKKPNILSSSLLTIVQFGQLVLNLGILKIAVLTILLVLVFIFAWKAPNWVKEMGIIALVASVFIEFMQWIQTLGTIIEAEGSISPVAICFGIIIYVISLVLRIVNKPRL